MLNEPSDATGMGLLREEPFFFATVTIIVFCEVVPEKTTLGEVSIAMEARFNLVSPPLYHVIAAVLDCAGTDTTRATTTRNARKACTRRLCLIDEHDHFCSLLP